MNINIIVSNYTFIKNNNSVNHIKKLLLYYINGLKKNITSSSNNVFSLKIFKFDYSLEEDKIIDTNINFKDNIENIIHGITSINYKLYNENNKINKPIEQRDIIKLKCDEIFLEDVSAKVILISSFYINKYNTREFFNIFENKIKIVNIGSYNNFHFDEPIGDEKVNLINHQSCFNDFYNKALLTFFIKPNLNDFEENINFFNDFIIIEKESINRYITTLSQIDEKILLHIKENEDEDNEDKDNINTEYLFKKTEKFLCLKINTNQNTNNLVINCQKNTLITLLENLSSFSKIKTIHNRSIYEEDNIKSYSKLYESVYKNINFQIKNKNKNKIIKDNKIDFSKIVHKEIDDIYEHVTKLTHSTLTLSNIVEEFNDFNIYGIMIFYDVSNNNTINKFKNELISYNSYPGNNKIKNISLDWSSLSDYNELLYRDVNIRGNQSSLNLKKFAIDENDNEYNKKNCVLPIYFNECHWKMYRCISSYYLSLINDVHISNYDKNYDNIYFYALLRNFSYFNFSLKPNKVEYFQNFVFILRTCIKIMQEYKYYCSLEDKYSSYVKNLNKDDYLFNISSFVTRTLQYIVFNGKEDIKIILEKIIQLYTELFIDDYLNMGFWDNEMSNKERIDYLKENYYNYIKGWISLRNDILKISKFIKNIYKIFGFNKFIKYIDSCYGTLNDKESEKFINFSNKLFEEINFKNYFNYLLEKYFKEDFQKNNIEIKFEEIYDDLRSNKTYREKYGNRPEIFNNEDGMWEEIPEDLQNNERLNDNRVGGWNNDERIENLRGGGGRL